MIIDGTLPISVAALHVLFLTASAVLTGGLAIYTWRHRFEPGALPFSFLMLAVTVWTAGYAIGLVTLDPRWRLVWENVTWFGIVLVPVFFLLFALEYTGYDRYVSRETFVLLSIHPLVTLLLVWTNSWHGFVWTENRVVVVDGIAFASQELGPWFWVNLLYAYGLIGVGSFLLLRLVFYSDYLYIDQSILVLVGVVAPLLGNVVSILAPTPYPGIDLVPYAFTITGLTFGYAIFRYRLFKYIPATRQIGRKAAIKDLEDGVLIVNNQQQLVDLNPAAADVFDCEPADVLGQPIRSLVPASGIDFTSKVSHTEFDRGGQTFELRSSPIYDQHDRYLGNTITVQDITEVKLRQQRLEVLNRVLRHNLRNDMDAVRAYAELIPEEEYDSADLAERIEKTSMKLVELGNKARKIERIMTIQKENRRTVDVTTLIHTVADGIRDEYPGCDLTLNLPEEVWIVANRSVLQAVLENVFENAIEHNDAADPRIEVTVSVDTREDREWIRIAVVDNGPGIPEHELEALTQGEETPLEHASGLGLWLVRWGISQLGGDLSFDDNDPRGSVVTIELPTRADTPQLDIETDPASIGARR